jgi:hypothetical protein
MDIVVSESVQVEGTRISMVSREASQATSAGEMRQIVLAKEGEQKWRMMKVVGTGCYQWWKSEKWGPSMGDRQE